MINTKKDYSSWFSLVCFYAISTIVGCLIPDPVYRYIRYIWFVDVSQQNYIVPSIAMYH